MKPAMPRKGRGALSNREGRFESRLVEPVDDGWGCDDAPPPGFETVVAPEPARSIVTRNTSPDIPFDQSINPYRGCEHGCVYCYARPSHAFLNLSPGLDFETRLFYKADAAALLERELRRPNYRCKTITLGANTDPYQPIERRFEVTRDLLCVLRDFSHPVSVITKSTLVTRDIDILAPMARDGLASVYVSVTTLDETLKRTLEPRAASPAARLQTIRRLADAGIPVGVLVAPVIPAVNDHELEDIVAAIHDAGAATAGYVLLRLPHEVAGLFREWLDAHLPDRADHVMSLIRQARGGRDYDARFGQRMTGTGPYADLVGQRFRAACRKVGLACGERTELDTTRFCRPAAVGDTVDLFS